MHYIKNAISAIANATNEYIRESISEESVEIKSNFSPTFSNEGYSRYPRVTLMYSRGEYNTLEYFLSIGKLRFLLSPSMEIEPKPFSSIDSSVPDNELHIINHEDGGFCYFRFSNSISKENFQLSMGACLADLISLYSLQLTSSGRLSSATMISCLEKCHLLSAEERPLMQRVQEAVDIRQKISKVILQLKRHPFTVSRLEIQSVLTIAQNDMVCKNDVDVLILKRFIEQSHSSEGIEILCKEIIYDEKEESLGEDNLWGENLTTSSTKFTIEPVVAEPAPHHSYIEENLNAHIQGDIVFHFASPVPSKWHQTNSIDVVAGDSAHVYSPVLATVTWPEQPPITSAKAIPSHAETNKLEQYTPETTMILASLSTVNTSVSVQLVSTGIEDYSSVVSPMVEVRAVSDTISESTTKIVDCKKKKKNKKKKVFKLNGIDLEQLKQPIINAKTAAVESFEKIVTSAASNIIHINSDRDDAVQQLELLLTSIDHEMKLLNNNPYLCDKNDRKSRYSTINAADIEMAVIENEQIRIENNCIISDIQEEKVASFTVDMIVVEEECENPRTFTIETAMNIHMQENVKMSTQISPTSMETGAIVLDSSNNTLEQKSSQANEHQIDEKQKSKRANLHTNMNWTNIKLWVFTAVMLILMALSMSAFVSYVSNAPKFTSSIPSLNAERPKLLQTKLACKPVTGISDLQYQSPVDMELANNTVSVTNESLSVRSNFSLLPPVLMNSQTDILPQPMETENEEVSVILSVKNSYASSVEEILQKEIAVLTSKDNLFLATSSWMKSFRQKFKSIIDFPQRWLRNICIKTGSLFKKIIK